jgi:Bacteriocin-protection, YdeI or OmpD-Associated/Domain of unknown function (DUF1905)
MSGNAMAGFQATLEILGINPFVRVPGAILDRILEEAGKDKGPIPICGTINGNSYTQTLVRHGGVWRLYVNTKMLPRSPKRIGETVDMSIMLDRQKRDIQTPEKLARALDQNIEAKKVFDAMAPSRRHEIVRYISRLKSETVIEDNVAKAIGFLLGRNAFAGRDKPI